MKLNKNQLVVFENGYKAGYLEIRWSNKHQAFYYVSDELDDDGKNIFYYSTTVIEKIAGKKKNFVPSKEVCTFKIHPLAESKKAYQIADGTNGRVGKNHKEFYKWVAKSVCYIDEEGNIFAPSWAMN